MILPSTVDPKWCGARLRAGHKRSGGCSESSDHWIEKFPHVMRKWESKIASRVSCEVDRCWLQGACGVTDTLLLMDHLPQGERRGGTSGMR